jgi:hypothetical protein
VLHRAAQTILPTTENAGEHALAELFMQMPLLSGKNPCCSNCVPCFLCWGISQESTAASRFLTAEPTGYRSWT